MTHNKHKIKFDSYLATAYAEGFGEGENATPEEQLEAWAYLIKHGLAWRLQGWFGRQADSLIESGAINRKGVINWDAYYRAVERAWVYYKLLRP